MAETKLWRQPDFLGIFVGQGAGGMANQLLLLAITWSLLTHSGPGIMALVLGVWSLPEGIVLLGSGLVSAYKTPRLLTMLATGLTGGVTVMLSMAPHPPLPLWIGLVLILGISEGILAPQANILLPASVPAPQLLSANRHVHTVSWLSRSLGPAMAGLFIARWGIRATFLITAAFYAISLLGWGNVSSTSGASERNTPPLKESFTAAVQWIVHHAALRWLLPLFAAGNFLILGTMAIVLPMWDRIALHGGAADLGWLLGSFGMGMVLGTVTNPWWANPFWESPTGFFLLFAVGDLSLATTALFTHVGPACITLAVSGFAQGPASALYRTWLQRVTPKRFRAHVMGMTRAVTFGLQPLSRGIAGLALGVWPPALVMALSALGASLTDLGGGWISGRQAHMKSATQNNGNERVDDRYP